MDSSFQINATVTQAGIEAAFSSSNNGVALELSYVALGSATYTPSVEQTSLVNEIERVQIVSGQKTAYNQLHLETIFGAANEEYWVQEIGFFLADGTLFALWSNDKPYFTITLENNSSANVEIVNFGNFDEGVYKIQCIGQAPVFFELTSPDGTMLGQFPSGASVTDHFSFNVSGDWQLNEIALIRVYQHQKLSYRMVSGDTRLVVGFDLVLDTVPANSIQVVTIEPMLDIARIDENFAKMAKVIIKGQRINLLLARQIRNFKKSLIS